MLEGTISGNGAHVKASTLGLKGRLLPSSSPVEPRRGLFTKESDEELDNRLGVEDFLRALPLLWVEPLLGGAESSSPLTTHAVESGRPAPVET